MQVFVNEIPLCDVTTGDKTVGQVIDSLRGQIQADDRLVVQIECEGRVVPPEEIDTTLKQPISNLRRLDLHTESTLALAHSALETIAGVFHQTDSERTRAVEHLAAGQVTEAMHALIPCVQAWQGGFEALWQVATLRKVDLDSASMNNIPILTWIKEWSDQLRQIKEALQNQDFVLLSDILQYEMDSTAEAWPKVIQTVALAAGIDKIELPKDA